MSGAQLLSGKVAGITGGLTGIGRAIALDYIKHGAYVAINHLRASDVDGLKQDFIRTAGEENQEKFILVPGDVSDPTTGPKFIEAIVRAFGRLDIFVSNAGICEFKEFLEISPALFDQTVSVNLSGAFYTTQAAARQMTVQPRPGGSIIGVSSISALVGGGQQAHYTPTKAGIASLMQSCAVALGKYNIRCNALLPGTIRTQLNEEDLKDEAKCSYMEERIPLGRLGQPKDMAGPAVFLACDELSGYVVNYHPSIFGIDEKPADNGLGAQTGAQLLVDGGLFVNLQ